MAGLLSGVSPAQGPVQLWNNGVSTYDAPQSVIWSSPAKNMEFADDFDVQGVIERLTINGYGCFNCAPPPLQEVIVRFYSWNAGTPGQLLDQRVFPAGSPLLQYNANNPETFDITLPVPFLATGKTFLSVQAKFAPAGYWGWWVSNLNAPKGSRLKVKNHLNTQGWVNYQVITGNLLNADLSFILWGDDGQPIPQNDPCGLWDPLPAPMPATSDHALIRAIKTFATDDAWAVGWAMATVAPGATDAITMAMHWDGVDWTLFPTPNPTASVGGGWNDFQCLDGVASNDLWLGGSQVKQLGGGWVGSHLMVQHWDGSQWTVMNTPDPPSSISGGVSGEFVEDVKVFDSQNVWFVGSWNDYDPATAINRRIGLLMRWNGSQFEIHLPQMVDPQGQEFLAVDGVNKNDIWAVGGRAVGGNSNATLIFHWDGSSWSHVPAPTPGMLRRLWAVEAVSTNDVWAAGSYSPTLATTQPLLLHWDGGSWTQVPTPTYFSALKGFSASDVWGVSSGVWHYDGTSWTQTETFPSVLYPSLSAIDGVSTCRLMVGGVQTVIGQVRPFIARHDASTFWDTSVRIGCVSGSTPATIFPLTPPKLGTDFQVAMDDPENAGGFAGSGGSSLWLLSLMPSLTQSCGMVIPSAGFGGGAGELLIDAATLQLAMSGQPWGGPGQPATYSLALPLNATLIGLEVATQGAVFELSPVPKLVFTPALDIRLGE